MPKIGVINFKIEIKMGTGKAFYSYMPKTHFKRGKYGAFDLKMRWNLGKGPKFFAICPRNM